MEKLKRYDLNCNIFNVYDYDGLSMQELLCQFFTKINECVDFSNSTLNLCEWLVNEGLKQEVAIKLTNWLNDGTLENIINETLFENLNKKIDNVNSQLDYNVNTLKLFGAKFDGDNDDSIALNKAIQELEEYSTIYIPSNVTLTLKSTVNVNRHINLKCLGNINAPISDMVLFRFGSQDKSIRHLNWEINNITGLGSTHNQTCFLFNNASFNKFKFNNIERFKYILHFKGLDKNASLGQNLFYYTSFKVYDKAIYFEGANNWSNAPWAEGNQFMGGFIVQGNVGLELTPNIKCNAIFLQGAVDNMEIENSYDILNNSTPPPTYNTGNLFLSNFYRDKNCVFGVNDARIEPNTGLYVNGSIETNGLIRTKNGDTSVELSNGSIELCATDAFIDMKNNLSEDRDVRLSANNNEFIVSAGDRTKLGAGLRIKDNKITKIFPVGMNYGIPIGSRNVTIELYPEQDNINYAVNVTPSWLTTYRVYNKTTSSFSIEFGSPATGSSAWIDYMLIGNVNY